MLFVQISAGLFWGIMVLYTFLNLNAKCLKTTKFSIPIITPILIVLTHSIVFVAYENPNISWLLIFPALLDTLLAVHLLVMNATTIDPKLLETVEFDISTNDNTENPNTAHSTKEKQ